MKPGAQDEDLAGRLVRLWGFGALCGPCHQSKCALTNDPNLGGNRPQSFWERGWRDHEGHPQPQQCQCWSTPLPNYEVGTSWLQSEVPRTQTDDALELCAWLYINDTDWYMQMAQLGCGTLPEISDAAQRAGLLALKTKKHDT